MKIEKLILQNINSLEGEYEIDFRHPALAQHGMFVITGPTGSGKTSILDAICFGLYGRSPRQKSMQQERDEIMTHGADVCSATVWYEHEGVHYRSRACHRRTKRKDSQKPFRALEGTLFRLSAEGMWEQLNQTKADFKVLTQQITGLSYENFSRCMLLAQGDFAAFLKANENERAEVLSTITGTGIYARIGRIAHERVAEVQRQIEELHTQKEMPEEERTRAETARDDTEQALAHTETRLKHVEACKRWMADEADKKAKYASAQAAAEAAAQALQSFQTEQDPALQRAEAALRVKPQADTLAELRKQYRKWEEKATTCETRHAAAAAALRDKQTTAEQARQRWVNEAPALQQKLAAVQTGMRPEETRLHLKQADLATRQADAAQKQKAHGDLQQRLQQWAQDLQSTQKTLAQQQEALQQVAADATLGERLPLLQGRLNDWLHAPAVSGPLPPQALIEAELTTAQEALATAKPRPAILREIAELKRRRLNIEDQLAALYLDFRAGKLERCPCCGATTPGERQAVLNEEVQLADKEVQVAEQELQRCQERVEELSKHLQAARLRQAFAEALGEEVADLPAARQAVQALKTRKSTYDHLQKRVAETEKACADLQAKHNTEAARADELRATAEESERLCHAAQKEYATLRVAFSAKWGEGNTADALEKQYQSTLDTLTHTRDVAQDRLQQARVAEAQQAAALQQAREQLPNLRQQLDEKESAFATTLAEHSFADADDFAEAARLLPQLPQLQEKKQTLQHKATATAALRTGAAADLEALQAACPLQDGENADTLPATEASLHATKAEHKELLTRLLGILRADDMVREENKATQERKAQLEAEKNRHARLKEVLGGEQDGFKKYAQQITFDLLLRQANIELRNLTTRYELRRQSEKDNLLGIAVIDHELGIAEGRAASNLSGGESFLVSLALALGLSRLSNATRIDSLFLDEGFGTLDADTLENVVGSLQKLHASGKTIGIISHVPSLRERIPARIEVQKNQRGAFSTLTGNPAIKRQS